MTTARAARALDGRLLLAIRARTARAAQGHHQSLRQTEADREALVLEVQRLREELELMPTPRRTPMPDDLRVYIAEAIDVEDNPVDGRTRIAVCATLNAALRHLREHPVHGGDLVATPTESSALGTDNARTWAVHPRDEAPSDEGWLWITEEQVHA